MEWVAVNVPHSTMTKLTLLSALNLLLNSMAPRLELPIHRVLLPALVRLLLWLHLIPP